MMNILNHINTRLNCSEKSSEIGSSNRMVFEFVILCRALQLSGDNYELKLIPFPLNLRVIDQLNSAKVIISGMTMWSTEKDNNNVTKNRQ